MADAEKTPGRQRKIYMNLLLVGCDVTLDQAGILSSRAKSRATSRPRTAELGVCDGL
jgi:hypothetical protein